MVRPHSRALVSPGLPACLPCLPHVCLWRLRPPFRGLVPPCLPVLDAVSVFPRSCPPLCPFLFPYLGWCVRVSEALSPFLFSFVGWCVCLPEVCPPLSPLVSHCLPACVPHMCAVLCDRLPDSLFFSTCVPVLDGASAFPRSCLHLSPIVFPFACVWMVWPTVSHCPPYICACVGFPRSCLRLSLIVSPQVRQKGEPTIHRHACGETMINWPADHHRAVVVCCLVGFCFGFCVLCVFGFRCCLCWFPCCFTRWQLYGLCIDPPKLLLMRIVVMMMLPLH